MSTRYRIARIEKVPNTSMVNVYFYYGATKEGNVTVPEWIAEAPELDAVISLQLLRLGEQLEQLAAGGE